MVVFCLTKVIYLVRNCLAFEEMHDGYKGSYGDMILVSVESNCSYSNECTLRCCCWFECTAFFGSTLVSDSSRIREELLPQVFCVCFEYICCWEGSSLETALITTTARGKNGGDASDVNKCCFSCINSRARLLEKQTAFGEVSRRWQVTWASARISAASPLRWWYDNCIFLSPNRNLCE